MSKITVLQIMGIDDTRKVTVQKLNKEGIARYRCTGNVELAGLLDPDEFIVNTLTRGLMESEPVHLDLPDVVLSAICDPDTNGRTLKIVADVVEKIGRPVVNPPERVMTTTRAEMSERLQGIDGLIVPKTVRLTPEFASDINDAIEDGTISYPFLFREAGAHGGTKLALLESKEDLRLLDQFAFDGRTFYATEFVDFRSDDGLYRKYRVLLIGGVPFPKHLIVSDHWNIHAEDRHRFMDETQFVREEERFLDTFTASRYPALTAIADELQLDYCGVDFALDANDQLVLFEANACFRALVGRESSTQIESHETHLARIKEALTSLIRQRASGTA